MRPLFTIHAGEYLAGLHIQKRLKLNAWIPAKDTGIDLLVTDVRNRHAVSLQVKYGKDFLPEEKVAEVREKLRCFSWFVLDWAKLNKSEADYWVFVLRGFMSKETDFVVIPTPELRQRMAKIHGADDGKLHSYFCTIGKRCWEPRGLSSALRLQIAKGTYEDPAREFSGYLNEKGWGALTDKLKS